MATFGPCGEITINGVTPVLAPDLTYPGDRLGLGTQTIKQISGIINWRKVCCFSPSIRDCSAGKHNHKTDS